MFLNGGRVKIFSNTLNQGDTWRQGSGNIKSNLQDWRVGTSSFCSFFVTIKSMISFLECFFCSTVGIWGGWSWRQRQLHCSGWHRSFSLSVPRPRFVSVRKSWLYYVTFLKSPELIWNPLVQSATKIIQYKWNKTKISLWKTQSGRANVHMCSHKIKQGGWLDWE